MKAIKMKLPNDGRDRVPTKHFLKTNEKKWKRKQMKLLVSGICYKKSGSCDVPWEFPNNSGYYQGYWWLSTNWGHLHNSLNRKKSSQCLHRAFTPTCEHLWYREVLCMLPKGKGKYQLAKKPSVYSGNLPTRYTGATVVQSLWEEPLNIWLKVHSRTWNPFQYCLGDEEPETC